jgi:hypothetical protein
MSPRTLPLYINGGDGRPLEGATIAWRVDGHDYGTIEKSDGRSILTFDVSPQDTGAVEVTVSYPGQETVTRQIPNDVRDYTIVFSEVQREVWWMKHFPALIGILFVGIAIALAFTFPNPTSLQVRVILAVLSLGGGAFASEIPGLLQVDVKLGSQIKIAAASAMGIFVLLYLVVPAK